MSEIRKNRITGRYIRIGDDGVSRELTDAETKAGKTSEGDVFLTEERASQLGVGPAKPQLKAGISGIKPLTQIQRISRTIGAAIPVAGSIGGGLVGSAFGPKGTLAGSSGGAFLGSLAQSGLQKLASDEFGEPSENSFQKALIDATINAGLDLTGGMLSKIPSTKIAIARRIARGGKIPTEVRQTFIEHPELNPTTAQASGSQFAGFVENLLAPIQKRKIVGEQQNVIQNIFRQITPDTPPDFTADVVLGELQRGYNAAKVEAGGLFQQLENEANKNIFKKQIVTKQFKDVMTGKITTKTAEKEIKAPVEIKNTQSFAKKLMQEINESEFKIQEDAKPALEKLREIANIKGPISLKDALAQKRIAGNKGLWRTLPNYNEAEFQKLNRLLDQDIHESFLTNPNYKNGKQLNQLYSEANAKWTRLNETFGEGTNTEDIINTIFSGIEDIKKTLEDPVKIQKVINGSLEPATTKRILANEYLNQLWGQATSADKVFDKTAVYDVFISREQNPIVRKLFNAQERNKIARFFEAVQHLDPKLPLAGVTALGIRTIGAGLVFGPGLIQSAMTQSLSQGTKTSGLILAAVTGGHALAKTLLNPRTAALATELLKLPPKSPQAIQIGKKLFVALKGTQLMLQTPDGTIWGTATINDKGKIEANQF